MKKCSENVTQPILWVPWYGAWHLTAEVEEDEKESDEKPKSARNHVGSNLDIVQSEELQNKVFEVGDNKDIKRTLIQMIGAITMTKRK